MPPTVIFQFPDDDADVDRWRRLPGDWKCDYPCWECGRRLCYKWENVKTGFWRAYCDSCAARLPREL